MARRWLPPVLAVLLFAGCAEDSRAFAVVPARPAPELEASLPSGGHFRLSEQRGKVVVVSFGYMSCPDVCPTTLSQLRSLLAGLGAAARDVEVVFVSVDPERDDARRLEAFVHAFHPRFTGLRLEGAALESVLSAYQVTVLRHYGEASRYAERPLSGDLSYTVDHTAACFVIDRRGVLRLKLPYTLEPSRMRAAVEQLLAEEA